MAGYSGDYSGRVGAPAGTTPYVVTAAVPGLTSERILTGTSNQIVVTDNGAGSTVVLSLPQSIATTSTPQFAGLTLTGQMTANAGTASAPSIRGDDADSGVNISANNVSLVSDGVATVVAGNDGLALGAPNTRPLRGASAGAGTPGITISGDTDTGTWSDADNQWYITAGGTAIYRAATTGSTLAQAVSTSGSPTLATFTGAAHTTLAASTEAIDVNYNLARAVQFAQGALTTQRGFVVQAPTYSFATGSSTLTNAVLVDLVSAPVASTNATFTATSILRMGGAASIGPTSTSMTYSGLNVPAHTITVTGSTQVTSASMASAVRLGAITLTDTSSVTIDQASTLYIAGPPVAAGSVVLTSPWAIHVDSGDVVFDGLTYLGGSQTSGLTGTVNVGSTANDVANLWRASADTSSAVLRLMKSRGTLASPGAISANDVIGTIVFNSHDGGNFENAAQIQCINGGSVATDQSPGTMTFWTTPESSSTLAERARITAAGLVLVGLTDTTSGSGQFSVGTASGDAAHFVRASADTTGSNVRIRKARGTLGTPAAIGTSDVIGQIIFQSYDTNSWGDSALVAARSGGAIGDGNTPGYLAFATTPVGSSTLVDRFYIASTGACLFVVASQTTPGEMFQFGNTGGIVTAGANGGYMLISPTMTEAGSSTHAIMAGVWIAAPVITNGVAATTDAASLYIAGPPTGITPTNPALALWVDAGPSRFDGSILVGATAIETGSTNTIVIAEGTAPNATISNTGILYAATSGAGADTVLAWYGDGDGGVDTGQADSASSVRVRVNLNGVEVVLLAI